MKKRSFFERLTGSIRMEEEDEVVIPKKRNLSQYDLDYEDDDTVEDALEPVEQEIEEEEAQLAVDVYETANDIIIKTMTAGVKKEDLAITVSREAITIKGIRENKEHHSYKNAYHVQELYWGAFSRTVDLPDEVDIEQASAHEHHGLVTITLPKFDKKRKATLKVQ